MPILASILTVGITTTATSTSITTASTTTSMTSTTTATTSTTSTTTTTMNPCLSNSLRWNTTGVTISSRSQYTLLNGISFDSNGILYFADETPSHVVWKLPQNASNSTIFSGTLGSWGSAANQFNNPQDVYVDSLGNVYVVDAHNQRIQKFVNGSNMGITIAGITGSSGSALNQMSYPRYFAFDMAETYLYVADSGNNRVLRFNTNATAPTNGSIVAGGNGAGNTNTTLNNPYGVALSRTGTNDLFIANKNSHTVIKWTPGAASGIFVAGIPGVSGSSASQLNNPYDIITDSYQNLYVVDGDNHRIQMFCNNNSTGTTIAGTGASGSSSTQLNNPRSIAFDSSMNLYVTDFSNSRIQMFRRL